MHEISSGGSDVDLDQTCIVEASGISTTSCIPVVRPAKSTGGSPHLSAISRQTLAISVRTSYTTQVHQHDARQAIGQLVDIALPHQGPLLLLDPDAQQRRLG